MHEEGCDWEMWTACAIDGLAVGDAIDFVGVHGRPPTDDNGKAEDVTEACAQDAKGLDFDAITACHDGDEGFKLLEAASERYLAAIADEPESFIPDFFINGVHQIPTTRTKNARARHLRCRLDSGGLLARVSCVKMDAAQSGQRALPQLQDLDRARRPRDARDPRGAWRSGVRYFSPILHGSVPTVTFRKCQPHTRLARSDGRRALSPRHRAGPPLRRANRDGERGSGGGPHAQQPRGPDAVAELDRLLVVLVVGRLGRATRRIASTTAPAPSPRPAGAHSLGRLVVGVVAGVGARARRERRGEVFARAAARRGVAPRSERELQSAVELAQLLRARARPRARRARSARSASSASARARARTRPRPRPRSARALARARLVGRVGARAALRLGPLGRGEAARRELARLLERRARPRPRPPRRAPRARPPRARARARASSAFARARARRRARGSSASSRRGSARARRVPRRVGARRVGARGVLGRAVARLGGREARAAQRALRVAEPRAEHGDLLVRLDERARATRPRGRRPRRPPRRAPRPTRPGRTSRARRGRGVAPRRVAAAAARRARARRSGVTGDQSCSVADDDATDAASSSSSKTSRSTSAPRESDGRRACGGAAGSSSGSEVGSSDEKVDTVDASDVLRVEPLGSSLRKRALAGASLAGDAGRASAPP